MTTLLYTDPAFARHETPRNHPECAARMASVETALSGPQFAHLDRRSPTPAPYEAIAACHPSSYIDTLTAAIPDSGMIALDADTHVGPHSFIAARLASGGVINAIDAVMADEARNAFIASRPPGHHAETAHPMGFCLINHVAIGARHVQKAHGIGRVAIVDFDVHHGNGTQDIFERDASVLYVSTHQSPHYPGTGAPTERGVGNIVNLPLSAGTVGAAYRHIFDTVAMPAVRAFAPEFLILSAGFDAHADDPLGDIRLLEDDFVWITERMMEIADEFCGDRLVSCLEGGYDLAALGRSAAAHVATLAKA
ncbi:histone deacetylase family protein [Acuticoccus sp. M5D2P5]|uniref:histone deacetylase family protein n=1 Tax=Acuticoccus kalidii TaxID=2910977 RepID=UPI001F1ACF4D|nr:histone deacetylase family protein [Acuticoccus kalidii]MCF3934218.1 histone deacetylase family protein [Acuticoccus kalidii]